MGAGILKVLANQLQAAAALVHSGANDVQQLQMEVKKWDEEVLDDGVVQLLHKYFLDMVLEAECEL